MVSHCRTADDCNTLQHTATDCSTLQQTAAHCNRLQHIATDCSTLQHLGAGARASSPALPVVHVRICVFSVLSHCEEHNTFRHTPTHRHTLKRTATHCNALQHPGAGARTLPALPVVQVQIREVSALRRRSRDPTPWRRARQTPERRPRCAGQILFTHRSLLQVSFHIYRSFSRVFLQIYQTFLPNPRKTSSMRRSPFCSKATYLYMYTKGPAKKTQMYMNFT